jgi:hypothetical protein
MADFYGTDNVHFTIGSDEFNGVTRDANGNVRPVVFRSYDSFSQASQENAISRIYLGVHWIFDATASLQVGGDVANYVFANALLPVAHHHHASTGGVLDAADGKPQALSSGHGDTGLTSASRLLSSGGAKAANQPVAFVDRLDTRLSTITILQQPPTTAPNAVSTSHFATAGVVPGTIDTLLDGSILFGLLLTN